MPKSRKWRVLWLSVRSVTVRFVNLKKGDENKAFTDELKKSHFRDILEFIPDDKENQKVSMESSKECLKKVVTYII